MTMITEAFSEMFTNLTKEMITTLTTSLASTEDNTKKDLQKNLPDHLRNELLTMKKDLIEQLKEKDKNSVLYFLTHDSTPAFQLSNAHHFLFLS